MGSVHALSYLDAEAAVGYAKFYSHDAVIRVYDGAGCPDRGPRARGRFQRVVTHSLRIRAEQKAATMRLRPGDCENHRSEQAHCHRVAGIQWPHHRGMDICIPKKMAHTVRRYHGGQHRIIRFPGIHK